MGTNYYLHEKRPCSECHRDYEAKHIGKSSGGWCFSLHVIPEEGIKDLVDWQHRWSHCEARIADEYGREVTPDEMLKIITERASVRAPSGPGWYAGNHAEPGPNGLARHRIGRNCIGHGTGTWDLITGEFS